MLISPASTADQLTDLDDDGLFSRTAPPDALQGKALADRIDRVIGGLEGKTINIGARNDLYGTGFEDSLTEELEGRGATVGESVIYDPEQPSYNSEATQITVGQPRRIRDHRLPGDLRQGRPGAGSHRQLGSQEVVLHRRPRLDRPGRHSRPGSYRRGWSGSAPGTLEGSSLDAFDKLYTQAPGPPRNLFDSTTFDDVMLCYLGVGRRRIDGRHRHRRGDRRRHADRVGRSTPGSSSRRRSRLSRTERTSTTRALPVRSTWDENGDLSKYVYDISEFKGGKLVKLDTVEVSR